MAELGRGPTLDNSGYNRLFAKITDERNSLSRAQTWRYLPADPFADLGIHRFILQDQIPEGSEVIRSVLNVALRKANNLKIIFHKHRLVHTCTSSFKLT